MKRFEVNLVLCASITMTGMPASLTFVLNERPELVECPGVVDIYVAFPNGPKESGLPCDNISEGRIESNKDNT